jgi:hypothetical protein
MPGIGDEIDGPMQQAPQPGRHGSAQGRAFTVSMRFSQDIGRGDRRLKRRQGEKPGLE